MTTRQFAHALAHLVVFGILMAGNPVGLWPALAYLTLFAFWLHTVDEGVEARRLERELRSWLT